MEFTKVTIHTEVMADMNRVWSCFTEPEHITQWCQATDEWHAPFAENDLRPGGRFITRMEAKDGSMGFDFGGVYTKIEHNQYIEYTLDDNRKVSVMFRQENDAVKVTEVFEAEATNPVEMQQAGWQTILNNFKNYVETL